MTKILRIYYILKTINFFIGAIEKAGNKKAAIKRLDIK